MIRDLWCDLLCFIFEHRWMKLESKFLADELKDELKNDNARIELDVQYHYCYRCNLLVKSEKGIHNAKKEELGKVTLHSLPWNTDNDGLSWPPNHPFLEWCTSVKYFFVHLWEWPGDTYREIKYFIQRGKRGYSDRDGWGMHSYTAEIILAMLKKLKENDYSIPSCITHVDGKEVYTFEEGKKKWDDILDTMIFTWDITVKVDDNITIFYTSDPKQIAFFDEMKKKYPNSYRILTKEEQERYDLGWKLFKDHFFSLWD